MIKVCYHSVQNVLMLNKTQKKLLKICAFSSTYNCSLYLVKKTRLTRDLSTYIFVFCLEYHYEKSREEIIVCGSNNGLIAYK